VWLNSLFTALTREGFRGGIMKRALTAALLSGLFVFAVPQVAFAHESADHNGDCGAKTEKSAQHSEQQPSPDGQGQHEERQGDHQAHDDGSILF
jgi:hypothetical protein